jgi:hypothetical protein
MQLVWHREMTMELHHRKTGATFVKAGDCGVQIPNVAGTMNTCRAI